MGGDGPKQYRMLAGKPVLAHSLEAFCDHPLISGVMAVIYPDDMALYSAAAPDHGKMLPPVAGGDSRQESVLAGLEALTEISADKVLIHDAARPFVAAETITDLVNGVAAGTGAIPAHRVTDTLKRGDDNLAIAETVERNELWCAQTPQAFLLDDILQAHRRVAGTGQTFTDDAAIAEAAGMRVNIIEASARNFKLTRQEDMVLAQAMLAQPAPEFRTGHGYDVHRIGPGDGVWLCGHFIVAPICLIGHSDADVGLHALTDALLATIAAGDIGSHFPPSDPQWKGVSSDLFLRHAHELVVSAGAAITHVDVTLVCEAPKIGPHRDAMREKLCELLQLSMDRVSVKATTNETIGFIGRREGIAAMATATVRFAGQPQEQQR